MPNLFNTMGKIGNKIQNAKNEIVKGNIKKGMALTILKYVYYTLLYNDCSVYREVRVTPLLNLIINCCLNVNYSGILEMVLVKKIM